MSSWLTVVPISKEHFDLSAFEFRDGLSLRYAKQLIELPPTCDGCGSEFTVNHALDCKRGGLIVQRHNEIRDVLCDLSSLAWKQVIKEPVITDYSDTSDFLKADISIRGVWQPQAMASFDVRVIDTDASSYMVSSPQSIIANAEKEKKKIFSCLRSKAHEFYPTMHFG